MSKKAVRIVALAIVAAMAITTLIGAINFL